MAPVVLIGWQAVKPCMLARVRTQSGGLARHRNMPESLQLAGVRPSWVQRLHQPSRQLSAAGTKRPALLDCWMSPTAEGQRRHTVGLPSLAFSQHSCICQEQQPTWHSIQDSSQGLSSRHPMDRGPLRQLLKVIGMSSANGRCVTSRTTLPALPQDQHQGQSHVFFTLTSQHRIIHGQCVRDPRQREA